MADPLAPPPRKDPLVPTPAPVLPPAARSRTAHLLTLAAAEGRFALQRCAECGTVAYPPRDACAGCLSDDLPLTDLPAGGTIRSETTIRTSAELYFRERLPWRIGLVELDCGPVIVAHLHGDCATGDRVRLSLQLDRAGNAAAFARPEKDTPDMTDDRQWREMTADPKLRRALVTDGRAPAGRAIARALADAGATVFLGIADPWLPHPEARALAADDRIELVPLNAEDEDSVRDLCGAIGGRVDILVNSADYIRPGPLIGSPGASAPRELMQRHFLALVNLSQAFGPAMRGRGADGTHSAVAWVNVFSAYALANVGSHAAFSAVQAACLSLSHALRGELRSGGIRVINLFAGPTEDPWYQTLPPPKLAPRALGAAVVDALRTGREDVYVGDVAQDMRERIATNPKAAEREFNRA